MNRGVLAGTASSSWLDYVAGLGKATSKGFSPDPDPNPRPIPTLYDPRSTRWSDGGWVAFGYPCRDDGMYWFMGQGNRGNGEDDSLYAFFKGSSAGREGRVYYNAYDDTHHPIVRWDLDAGCAPGGSGAFWKLHLADLITNGDVTIDFEGTRVAAVIRGMTGQTLPLFNLKDSTGASVFNLTPNGSGLYGPALGKAIAAGYDGGGGGLPTLFDPSKATFDLGAFLVIDYAGHGLTWGSLTGGGGSSLQTLGQSTDGNHNAYARFDATAPNNSGVGGSANFVMNASDFAGEIFFTYDATTAQIAVNGQAAQTTALLDIMDSAGVHILAIAPGGKVGGVTPSDGDQLTWDAASGTIKWKGPLV